MARSSTDYLGKVPAASGTGPKNLSKTADQALGRVKATRKPGMKSASMPSASPAKAGAASRPPAGAGSGVAKATTPFASSPRSVNKAKTARPGRRPGGKLGKPRADFPSQI